MAFRDSGPATWLRTAAAAGVMTAATLAPAAAEDVVNVYTFRQPELIQPILDQFTKETGIATQVLFDSKAVIERMKAEAENSPADVLLTVDIGRVVDALDAGVLQPASSEVLIARVPENLRDPEGRWYALTQRARILYVSRERVAEDVNPTFEDLAKPEWKGRICTRSGAHDYNIGLLAAMIAHHGADEARAWLEGLRDNLARKPQGNDRAQVKAVWAGECDVAIGNSYYYGKMLEDEEQKEWADAVRPVFATIGGAGAHVNISGVGLAAGAPHPEAAMALMEYLVSDSAQQIYAELNYEYPVAPGVAPSEAVQAWGAFTPDALPITELAEHRAEALKMVNEVGYDDGPQS